MELDVLITTVPGDIHAGAVSVALERYGRSVARWYPPAYPLGDDISFRLPPSAPPRLALALGGGRALTLPEDSVRSFWYRRQGRPAISAKLHDADRDFARKSAEHATDSALSFVSRHAGLAINDHYAALASERSKMLQLEVAAACGLQCPVTLFSNSPKDIVDFIESQRGGVIFKSLLFVSWESESGAATNFTAPVTVDDLPSEEILRSSPGIFQQEIPKLYEIRVTVMGKWVLAVQLDSQALEDSRTDWRVSGPQVPAREISLPGEIRDKCLAVMRRLGLVFGCIDLIVTPEGEYVFLEVNQQGQFLWLEERAPSLRMLDAFAQFLGSGDPDFAGPTEPPKVSLESVRHEAEALLERDLLSFPFSLAPAGNVIPEP